MGNAADIDSFVADDEPRRPFSHRKEIWRMPSEAVAALGALAPNADLVFRFFAFFSRFECALKRSGFLREINTRAEPDWDKYANSLRENFANVDNQAFQDAVTFMLDAPPKRQVVLRNNALSWADTPMGQGEHREGYVLRLVRVVRNNLFHGGKYPIPIGPLEDMARNDALLNAGIAVLSQCLSLSDPVRAAFEEVA